MAVVTVNIIGILRSSLGEEVSPLLHAGCEIRVSREDACVHNVDDNTFPSVVKRTHPIQIG
jgi:hypothetical protein